MMYYWFAYIGTQAAFDCGSFILHPSALKRYSRYRISRENEEAVSRVMYKCFNKNHTHFFKSQSNHATIKLTILDV